MRRLSHFEGRSTCGQVQKLACDGEGKNVHGPATVKAIGFELVRFAKHNSRVEAESDSEEEATQEVLGPNIVRRRAGFGIASTNIEFGELQMPRIEFIPQLDDAPPEAPYFAAPVAPMEEEEQG